MLTGEQLRKNIMEQLHWDARLENARIEVELSDNKVVLSGTVPSLSQLQAAELTVRSIPGVYEVDNRLKILHGTVKLDADISSALQAALRDDREIDQTAVQPVVEDGMVTLEGTVDAYWKKERVEEIASHTAGVVLVQNKLAVVSTGDKDDLRIATDIKGALERMGAADTRYVTVEVQNGIVTLSGKVPHWNSFLNSEYAARHTRGVADVKNELLIT